MQHACHCCACWGPTLIARFMGLTLGRSGADRTQVGPMLAHQPCYLGSSVRSKNMRRRCDVQVPFPYLHGTGIHWVNIDWPAADRMFISKLDVICLLHWRFRVHMCRSDDTVQDNHKELAKIVIKINYVVVPRACLIPTFVHRFKMIYSIHHKHY